MFLTLDEPKFNQYKKVAFENFKLENINFNF